MGNNSFVLLALVLGLFVFISGCVSEQPTCNKPYILVGTGCCLDANNNSICDKDEAQPANQTGNQTLVTGNQTLVTGNITQNQTGNGQPETGNQTQVTGNTTALCNAPYYEYKTGDCCLDTNNNKICDSDEAPPANQTGNGTQVTGNVTQGTTPYCGDGACNANETSSTCCKDCGCPAGKICLNNSCAVFQGFKPMEVKPTVFCGDGICSNNESKSTCCTDCGCSAGQVCKNNSCMFMLMPIMAIPMAMPDKKISKDYVSSLSKPRIWGNLVTWTQTFDTKQQVMLYNIQTNTLTQLTNLSSSRYYPDVSGFRLVWEDYRRPTSQENSDTYLYDLANGIEGFVTSRIGYKKDQSIDGNLIAWTEGAGTDSYVYLFDLSNSQEKKLTQGDEFPVSTDISWPNVIWGYYECSSYPCKYGISRYNILTGQTTNLFESESVIQYSQVRIYGNNVVYVGGEDENEQVFVYNIATKINTQLTTATGKKFGPAICNNTVVWTDERNGNWDIYSYDLVKKQETAITTDEDDQEWPDIYGNKIVYWGSGNELHIYMHTLGN